ncbi:glycosyltransferase [Thiorhodococcus fuscus]|uniref:Glycosyltransferase n=1 Tax=Thiorhodococcus fuscus TaxID=527200 RepID=A0ABW4YC50_9GAMM
MTQTLQHQLKLFLDTPRYRLSLTTELCISGWCFHAQERISALYIDVGGQSVRCQYGHRRDDVRSVYPDMDHSLESGFVAYVRLPAGRYPLCFRVLLEDDERTVPIKLVSSIYHLPLVPPYRQVARRFKTLFRFPGFALKSAREWYFNHRRLPRIGEFVPLVRLALNVHAQRALEDEGLEPPPGFSRPERCDSYQRWIELDRLTEMDILHYRDLLDADDRRWPLLSVVMPVYDPPREYFEAAISSVRSQIYPHWELCIADDCSPQPWLRERLSELAGEDSRIRWLARSENGHISRCTNSAVELARGTHLCLFDQDDLLTPDALMEVALALVSDPETDLLYSDDDKISCDGRRYDPQFKPDWNPELLLAYMYFSHLFVIRRELFLSLGGLRPEFDGSQDYDLALRASERARHIVHIPRILYHWRCLPGSTASSGNAKPASFEAGRTAIQEAFARRGIDVSVFRPEWARRGGLGIFWHDFPHRGPTVAVLIPSRNNWRQLKHCLDSLARTTYRDHEIFVIDNGSDDPETLGYLASLSTPVLTIPNGPRGFSFAAINNAAVRQVSAEYLLFLNDDTEVIEPQWLSRMVGYARIQGVGAVGARLIFPNDTIQHAGIVHGYYGGLAGPAFKGNPDWHGGYLSYSLVSRDYSAVTAACLLTPKALFEQFGGFDEDQFAVAYNDVDYCHRLVAAGYRCVYAAGAELVHYEGFSRGSGDDPAEVLAFRERYRGYRDPYYSPHLSLADEHFQIAARRLPRRSIAAPVRAIMCAFTLNHEGAPYSQYEMTLALARQGVIEPIVYSPTDGPLRPLYEQAGIEVVIAPHPMLGVFDLDAYEIAIARFASWIDSRAVDLVYGNTLQTFYAIAAARRLGKPSLWNIRESEPWQTYFSFLAPPIAARALECFADPYRVIFVADATRRQFEPLNSQNNFSVIHNGLNLARFDGNLAPEQRADARRELEVGDGDFVVLVLGTVSERKGQLDLVEACGHLPASLQRRLRVFIVGDRQGEYSSRVHQAHAALPALLRERVHIVPETGRAALYYAASDCFVCTSRIESYPRVILEAMLFGLPIISTPAFGIVEQVRQGINADIYSPGDARQLAERLGFLMTDPERVERYRRNAPLVLRSLTQFDEMVAAYASLFREAGELDAVVSPSTSQSTVS